jgi:hypothetical protein
MKMAGGSVEAGRLAAISGATALSRLADQVVSSSIHWQSSGQLTSPDREALTAAAGWLGKVMQLVDDPLDLTRSLKDLEQLPLIQSFGASGSNDRLGSLLEKEAPDGQAGSAAFGWLKDLVHKLLDGIANDPEVEALRRVFGAIAAASLSSAGDQLSHVSGSTWTTASGF